VRPYVTHVAWRAAWFASKPTAQTTRQSCELPHASGAAASAVGTPRSAPAGIIAAETLENMYIDWFKLDRLPFRLRPDPDFLYLADGIAPVFDALRAAAKRGRGTVSLCGEAGVGKTTLLNAIAQKIEQSSFVARVHQSDLTREELLAALGQQFGLAAPEAASARQWLAHLKRFIAAQSARGQAVAILVDTAQRLTIATLRELLNLAGSNPAPLLVLAGDPQLARQLELQATPDAAPHLALHLPRLTLTETDGYIQHRLAIAGSGTRIVFEPDTLPDIQLYTGGTPQLINVLCDNSMVIAETHNCPRVGLNEVRDAVKELKWVEFAARSPSASSKEPAALHPRIAAELDVQQRGKTVRRVALRPGRLVVGRDKDAGLHLDSEFISREHCQIITTAEQSFIEDLGSTNGMLVNGTRRQLHRLNARDEIVIGDHTLTYMESPASDE
jgi:general secretion pathway protein A